MKVLVVVDMQNDFIDGALGTPEAQAIVDKVVQKIDRWNGVVVCTKDTHTSDYLNTQEGRMLPVPHCIEYSPGHDLNFKVENAVSKFADDERGDLFVVNKPTFGGVDVAQTLGELDYDLSQDDDKIESITLVGLCTDICVISNALLLKAFFPEVPITVDAACCAGVTPESHKNALAAMKMCQIALENEEG